MFNPAQLEFARKRRGLSKKALAASIRVSSRTISAYEAGEKAPSKESLERLSRELKFPVAFFGEDNIDEIHEDNASFRALSRMTVGQKNSALAAGALAIALNRWIEEHFRLPEIDLPDYGDIGRPEEAAESLRAQWKLGNRPIKNLVHLLESKGVRFFSLAEDCLEIDAYSTWDNTKPFIFLNTRKSSERSRFDAAHELGHLILHQHGVRTGREVEDQANKFASSFLMPESSVLGYASRNPSLRSLLREKTYWGVSAMAFARRLNDLEMLSDWNYRQVCIRMSKLGYRRAEPNSKERETSFILRTVLGQLEKEGVSKSEIARDLRVHSAELDQYLFGLALTALPGGRLASTQHPTPTSQLKLVRSRMEDME